MAVAKAASPAGGQDLWARKHRVLKRKCEELEQLNEILFAKARKIHQLIAVAETEKRFLVKRLEQYEVVDLPKSPARLSAMEAANGDRRSELRLDVASHCPANPPPALLGPFPQPTAGSAASTPGNGELSPDAPLTIVMDNIALAPLPGPQKPHLPPKTTPTRPAEGSHGGGVPRQAVASTKSKKASKKSALEHPKEPQKGTSRKKKDVDPNAPKKPSNAFFWFCQEHRPSLRDQFKGEGVAGQHDLTKVLAKLWSETSQEDKKIYYERYQKDKQRYDEQMEGYTRQQELAIRTDHPG